MYNKSECHITILTGSEGLEIPSDLQRINCSTGGLQQICYSIFCVIHAQSYSCYWWWFVNPLIFPGLTAITVKRWLSSTGQITAYKSVLYCNSFTSLAPISGSHRETFCLLQHSGSKATSLQSILGGAEWWELGSANLCGMLHCSPQAQCWRYSFNPR